MRITRLQLQKKVNDLFWKNDRSKEEEEELKDLIKEACGPKYNTVVRRSFWVEFNPEYKKGLSRKSSNKYVTKNLERVQKESRIRMAERYNNDPEYREYQKSRARKWAKENPERINERNRQKCIEKRRKERAI